MVIDGWLCAGLATAFVSGILVGRISAWLLALYRVLQGAHLPRR